MTDDQYHALMEQMYDLSLCLDKTSYGARDIRERMRMRVVDCAPAKTLADAKLGVEYCIIRVDTDAVDPLVSKFNDDVLRLMIFGFVPGTLVTVVSRIGDALEVDLMGTKCALRNSEAEMIFVVRFT